eukprot:m.176433 g.176433  ORF g.176433 m.176433 type:complete len:510 (+) comp14899_c0_seq6:2239-3768(+)
MDSNDAYIPVEETHDDDDDYGEQDRDVQNPSAFPRDEDPFSATHQRAPDRYAGGRNGRHLSKTDLISTPNLQHFDGLERLCQLRLLESKLEGSPYPTKNDWIYLAAAAAQGKGDFVHELRREVKSLLGDAVELQRLREIVTLRAERTAYALQPVCVSDVAPKIRVYRYQAQYLRSYLLTQHIEGTQAYLFERVKVREWANSMARRGAELLDAPSTERGSWNHFVDWIGVDGHFPGEIELHALANILSRQIVVVTGKHVKASETPKKNQWCSMWPSMRLPGARLLPDGIEVFGEKGKWVSGMHKQPLLFCRIRPEVSSVDEDPKLNGGHFLRPTSDGHNVEEEKREMEEILKAEAPGLVVPYSHFGWIDVDKKHAERLVKELTKFEKFRKLEEEIIVGKDQAVFGSVMTMTAIETYVITCLRLGDLKFKQPNLAAYIGAITIGVLTTLLFLATIVTGVVLGWHLLEGQPGRKKAKWCSKAVFVCTTLFTSFLFVFQLYVAALLPPLPEQG